MQDLSALGKRAKAASRILSTASSARKDLALEGIASALEENQERILEANRKDCAAGESVGMSPSFLDRLRLDGKRICSMAAAVRDIIALPDPVGRVLGGGVRPNGLRISKVSVPLGVVGIIYEARPNVTADAASLCLKSSNVCILRGGKEAFHTNSALTGIMRDAVSRCGLHADVILFIEDTSRETAQALMRLNSYLDVLIPRGGAGLIRSVVENATVPVIETGVGNCHIYVDSGADLKKAVSITANAKLSRPSVCNAAETLLVHRDTADTFLPLVKQEMDQILSSAGRAPLELRGCPQTIRILGDGVKQASEEDYQKEFLNDILAVKVVDSLEEAMDHIAQYGTGHSECIVTENYTRSQQFLNGVDAAAVYVNASTRFTDGGEFGFGAEIGISTQKLHARGPMGLTELTTYKYMIFGSGQIR